MRKYTIPRQHRSFELVSPYEPSGDQPQAIKALVKGIEEKQRDQVLLGVTGSGKTFTMAQIINKVQRPAIIMAHNKTLAAQLYSEMKGFFPHNAVEYFISFYDYYQPEAYVPSKDIFVEKDSQINEAIDRMRHSATRSFLERSDTIVVASVSCIYGIGSPETYGAMTLPIKKGMRIGREKLMKQLIELQYKRNDVAFERTTFRSKGDIIDIFPSHMEDRAIRLSFFDDELEKLTEIDVLSGVIYGEYDEFIIYPASHYALPRPTLMQAVPKIQQELQERIAYFKKENRLVEAQRIEERTQLDLEYITTTGFCKGIENYSRHLTGRAAGEAPPTLFEYLPENALLFVDESHVTIPQIRAMYKGDRSRKTTLAEFGFRLPSCIDNRPLMFEEWEAVRPQTVFVSATPNAFELEKTHGVFVEQIIRPTGLVDPQCFIHPTGNQVEHLLGQILAMPEEERVLVTTLTKKMAEHLTEYLNERNIKARYMHADVETLERIEIIRDLRLGKFKVLVGINLLREGLDMPECSTVAILDADKEGFLRSTTALVQTIGRAARHVNGRVLLYADKMTPSLTKAMDETSRRREIQELYNKKHGIIPSQVKAHLMDIETKEEKEAEKIIAKGHTPDFLKKEIKKIEKDMLKHAQNLDFEKAIALRDTLHQYQQELLKVS